MDLYRVAIKASPAVEHPLFWEWKTGYLCMWLYAQSREEAEERADKIIAQLPYEPTGEKHCELASEPRPLTWKFPVATELEEWGKRRAEEVGLGLLLHCMPLESESFPETIPDGQQAP